MPLKLYKIKVSVRDINRLMFLLRDCKEQKDVLLRKRIGRRRKEIFRKYLKK